MKNNSILLALATFVLLLSSCSPRLTPFTQNLYENYGWSEEELKSIQFYLSNPVVLRRAVNRGSTEIISGKIKMINGREMEEVIIPEGTAGVLLFQPKTNRFAVGFEEGSNERYLMFGPNPKANDKFVLLAKDWERSQGKVSYEGKIWETPSRSAYASLMVNLKKINHTKIESRRAGGRTVN